MPTRKSTGARLSSAAMPLASIASATVAPDANCNSRTNWRAGSAYTTVTRSVASGINAHRFATEVVDHAVRDFLETGAHDRCHQATGVFEVERERDLAAALAERRERPRSGQAAERTFDELHRNALRRVERVARRERLGHAGDAHFEPGGQRVLAAFDDAGTGAPLETARVRLEIVDKLVHL